ncbi:MAG: MBL fold metallo-hydrolase [Betaproteobacteria bacterium]|nr:MBL fold metallo-hydrolase [Betaproteobacteria bacterium]
MLATAPPLEFPHAAPPADGTTLQVAPGVRWLRMLLPFALDHINLWLLDDDVNGEPGFTIVDCGLSNDATRAAWRRIFDTHQVSAKSARRLIVTHYHPDHAGNAAWLVERFGCEMWMTQGEYFTAHAVMDNTAGYSPQASLAFFKVNGLSAEHDEGLARRGHFYRQNVRPLPSTYRRMLDQETLIIGGLKWKVIVGNGHAPEHASLYCAALGVCISGDMLLPKISTNVSVWPVDPNGNPLEQFLSSICAYRNLPRDTLILPSHGLPFRGAHARVSALEQHHAERLAELEQAIAASSMPLTAFDVLQTLFRRKLDIHQMTFAMGEAVAHLHYLLYAGRVARSVGADGIVRYAPAKVK